MNMRYVSTLRRFLCTGRTNKGSKIQETMAHLQFSTKGQASNKTVISETIVLSREAVTIYIWYINGRVIPVWGKNERKNDEVNIAQNLELQLIFVYFGNTFDTISCTFIDLVLQEQFLPKNIRKVEASLHVLAKSMIIY
eukprot:snap_masked-scaffold_11-processed-gene-10.20-mRNA-1 protein AED:1.00 eAED:1.00 QI:0/-1/0/0/-1/1/1/0/138